jgi:hypothetical protein
MVRIQIDNLQSTICNRQSSIEMASNDYHFHWQVESTVEEVSNILEDTTSLVRWWPSFYLDSPYRCRRVGHGTALVPLAK